MGCSIRTRAFCRGFELLVNSRPTLLLGSSVRNDNEMIRADLTNPDFQDEHGKVVLSRDSIHIVRSLFVWNDTLFTRLGIRSFTDRDVELQIDLLFGNDFADIFEARGMRRARRGVEATAVLDANDVELNTQRSTAFIVQRSCISSPRQIYFLNIARLIDFGFRPAAAARSLLQFQQVRFTRPVRRIFC